MINKATPALCEAAHTALLSQGQQRCNRKAKVSIEGENLVYYSYLRRHDVKMFITEVSSHMVSSLVDRHPTMSDLLL